MKLLAIAPDDSSPAVACTAANVEGGRYPYDRYLLVYLRRNHGGTVAAPAQAYLALALSPAGQDAIAQANPGYLPLNASEVAEESRRLAALKP